MQEASDEHRKASLTHDDSQFREMFAKAPLGMVTTAVDGRFIEANEAYATLTGYSKEELPSILFISLTHPDEIENNRKLFQQLITRQRDSYSLEKRIVQKDGAIRWVRSHASLILDAEGAPAKVVGLVEDITERKNAEVRYHFLAESIPQMVWTAKPDGMLDYVNKPGCDYFGNAQSALLGAGWLQYVHPDDQPEAIRHWTHSIKTGEDYETDFRLKRKADAAWRLHLVRAVALKNEDGTIRQWFGTCTDIEERNSAARQIEESERQFRTLAETIPHLAWMADGAGDIFWYNRRWFDYTGTTLEEMSGWGWQKIHDPKILPEVVERWQRAIARTEPFEMVFPLRGTDGNFHHFLTRVEPVRNNDGEVVRWFGTNTDITEQRRTEEELRRMNRELEEFSYVASHDLQEPLRMVNIYSQLLLQSVDSTDEKVKTYSGFVRDGVKRMEVLIHDLLEFSRSVRTEEIEVGVTDLAVALHDALAVLDVGISETAATVHTTHLPQVRGDAPQMSHVFQNILSNALKYRKADVAPEIAISATREGNEWIVAIRDNGIGFEPQYAERIFGLFKRLYTKEYPGTGLGLAICKRIIERYGGRIWAESTMGEGSTFYFSLIGTKEP